MAAYDSDSSGGGDNDYTETNVLLGYASKEPQDDTITHLGGQPEWLDPFTPPPASLAKCKVCNDLMVLILQLNGDLPEVFPGHERRLYILTCRRKTCRRKEGSVRALRGTRISEAAASKAKQPKEKEEKEVPKPEPKPAVNLGASLFGAKPSGSGSGNVNPFAMGSGMNSFSTSSTASAQSNPFAAAGLPTSELAAKAPQNPTPTANENTKENEKEKDNLPKTFASVLSLNNNNLSSSTPEPPATPSEPYPTSPSLLPAPYPTLYLIDADYETLDSTPLPAPPQNTSIMDMDTDASASGGKEDKEVFESTHDTTFQKFADRLAQNPEQVLRYEFRGEPLLYSKTDAVGKVFSSSSTANSSGKITTTTNGTAVRIPRCGNCGKGRVFEAQVTPHAILELERDEKGLDGMEWGTLILGVCEGDCVPRGVEAGKTGYVEEWVGVQWEELGGRR